MSEPITASEAAAILRGLDKLTTAVESMQSDIQALTLEVRVNQAKNDEQFNTVRTEIKAIDAKVEAVRTELKAEIQAVRTELKTEIKAVNDKVDGLRSELRDDITVLRAQERATDARLWAFVVGLVTLVGGGVIKVLWFDRG